MKNSIHSSDKTVIGLQLTVSEAQEVYSLLECILQDNTPDGDVVDGIELISECLLHNDPELFSERHRRFSEATDHFSGNQGQPVDAQIETFAEAEQEYAYLEKIAHIYYRLVKAGLRRED